MTNMCSIKRAIWLRYYNQVAYDSGLISRDNYLRMQIAINTKYQCSTIRHSDPSVKPALGSKKMPNKD